MQKYEGYKDEPVKSWKISGHYSFLIYEKENDGPEKYLVMHNTRSTVAIGYYDTLAEAAVAVLDTISK